MNFSWSLPKLKVALLVSAWIEIFFYYQLLRQLQVALLVSAWIEIFYQDNFGIEPPVALLVSAWIEITCSWLNGFYLLRRTPRECVD